MGGWGGGKFLKGILEETRPEFHETYAWWLLWDSPEVQAEVPLFPDPEAVGTHYTLGPPSLVWTGLVLAAPAQPPAGDTGISSGLKCPDPARLGNGLGKHLALQDPEA